MKKQVGKSFEAVFTLSNGWAVLAEPFGKITPTLARVFAFQNANFNPNNLPQNVHRSKCRPCGYICWVFVEMLRMLVQVATPLRLIRK